MTTQQEIAHLADVPIAVQVELDRKMMTIGSILDLKSGSVIRLPRSAGENIDIFVGGSLIASGEVVIIEESMGVRITDFIGEE